MRTLYLLSVVAITLVLSACPHNPPIVPPPVPVGTHNVALTWNIVQNANSYNVYRGNVCPADVNIGSATTNGFLDTNIINGLTYCYQVSSVENGIESTTKSNTWQTMIPNN